MGLTGRRTAETRKKGRNMVGILCSSSNANFVARSKSWTGKSKRRKQNI